MEKLTLYELFRCTGSSLECYHALEMVEVTDTCLLNYGVNSPCITRKSCSRQLTQERCGVRCHLQLPVDKYIGVVHTKAFSANFHPVLFRANFSVCIKLAFVQFVAHVILRISEHLSLLGKHWRKKRLLSGTY